MTFSAEDVKMVTVQSQRISDHVGCSSGDSNCSGSSSS